MDAIQDFEEEQKQKQKDKPKKKAVRLSIDLTYEQEATLTKYDEKLREYKKESTKREKNFKQEQVWWWLSA